MNDEFEKSRAIIIDEQQIADHLYSKLLERGHIASPEECELIAEIMFDYMIECSVLAEIEEWEEGEND